MTTEHPREHRPLPSGVLSKTGVEESGAVGGSDKAKGTLTRPATRRIRSAFSLNRPGVAILPSFSC